MRTETGLPATAFPGRGDGEKRQKTNTCRCGNFSCGQARQVRGEVADGGENETDFFAKLIELNADQQGGQVGGKGIGDDRP
ncbi:MAG: hypothetical protein ACI9JL_004649, partial [Paracoccaceae bacterium]